MITTKNNTKKIKLQVQLEIIRPKKTHHRLNKSNNQLSKWGTIQTDHQAISDQTNHIITTSQKKYSV